MKGWHGAILAMAVGGVATSASLEAGGESHTDWAYPPLVAAGPAAPPDTVRHLPGASRTFREKQVHDLFHAVDWRPADHGLTPLIVRQGRPPGAMACGYCHLPTGQGRPENATLAGLPADYIVRQVADMRAGLRTGARPSYLPNVLMHTVAANVTSTEVKAAAGWFAAQRFAGHVRVIETEVVRGADPVAGVYRFNASAPPRPLGNRIVEGPVDFDRFELRDDTVRYVAYVPTGSISRGASLAATGGAGGQPCASCHASGLKGDIGPPLAGRSPTGLFRQLYAFKIGGRRGSRSDPMRQVTAPLSETEMIDLSAYAGSLRP